MSKADEKNKMPGSFQQNGMGGQQPKIDLWIITQAFIIVLAIKFFKYKSKM